MNRRLFVLAALAAAGCATVPPAGPPRILAPPGFALAELEPLHRAEAGLHALTVRVASNGCTTKADFAFYVERKGEAVILAFGRKRVDACRTVARAHADLTFTWAELGLSPQTPVFLLNPLLP